MTETIVRHLVATIAFRGTKAIHDVPANYATFSLDSGVRTPIEILSHMSDVILMAYRAFETESIVISPTGAWEQEVERFYVTLEALDGLIARGLQPVKLSWEQLIQGPIADVLTHIGQLLTLRRLAGSPATPERYSIADVRIGQIRPGVSNSH